MTIFMTVVEIFYCAIAILVFLINSGGPATLGLALLRGAFWPIWIAGFLRGAPMPMD